MTTTQSTQIEIQAHAFATVWMLDTPDNYASVQERYEAAMAYATEDVTATPTYPGQF